MYNYLSKNNWVYLIAIVIIALIILTYKNNTNIEGYNDQTGRYCLSCYKRNRNQCLRCFNCVWCEDQWGNGKCIGGDNVSGPYNYERCNKWTHGDPYSYMMKKVQHVDPTLSDCLGTGMKPNKVANYPRNMGYNSCGGAVRDNYGLLQ